jgi:DNA/RNA endonuclease YhcR with UshA esterase domain
MLALALSVLAVLAPATQSPPVITPAEAAKHIGERVIVEGKVTQIVLSVNLTTHMNFGGLYPNHVFTVTIFKADQSQFPGVKDYEGKVVQVEGVVRAYRGKPEIRLTDRSQIRLAE